VDVDYLTLTFELRPDVLAAPPPAGAVAVSVAGEPPLPAPLAAAVAAQLHAAWAAAAGAEAGGGDGTFGLGAAIGAARRRVSQLVGSMPQYLEAYEGVDAMGATARRFALVSGAADEAPAAAAAAAAPPPPPAAAAAGGPAPSAAAAARRPVVSRPPVLPPWRQQPPGRGSGDSGGGSSAVSGHERDLQWLKTKFGDSLRLKSKAGDGNEDGEQQQSTPAGFSLMLRPTDPAWGARGAIHITAEWGPPVAPDGAAGPLQLHVLPTIGVPAPVAAQLEAGLRHQAAAAGAGGGGGSALRSALKWIESYAGSAAAVATEGAPPARSPRPSSSGRPPRTSSGADGAGAPSSGQSSGAGGGGGDEGESSEGSGYSSGDYTDSSGADDSSSEGPLEGEDGAAAAGEGGGGASGSTAAGGGGGDQHSGGGSAYGIALEGLQLDLIDALEILDANLQISCSRCGEGLGAGLAPGGGGAGGARAWEWKGACGKCSAPLWVLLRPKIVHEQNNEIAALKMEGCSPVDLLPSLFAAQASDARSRFPGSYADSC
jgi:hypothetical protein